MPSRLLYLGCQPGQDVMDLQDALNALTAAPEQSSAYALLTVDGMFGADTASRVREFQQKNALPVDAVVGRSTWGVLVALLERIPGLQIHRPIGGSGPGPAKGMEGEAVHGKTDTSSGAVGSGTKGASGKGEGKRSGVHGVKSGKVGGTSSQGNVGLAGGGKSVAGAGVGMHGTGTVWGLQTFRSGNVGDFAGKGSSSDGGGGKKGGSGKDHGGGSKEGSSRSGAGSWFPWAGAMGADRAWAPAYKGYYKAAPASGNGKGAGGGSSGKGGGSSGKGKAS